MSTFAVFGMTRDMAVAEAKKKVATVKTDGSVPGGRRELTMAEWMEAVEKRAMEIMAGHTVRQLSPMFDAPQYAEEFIALARKTLECRDMHIKLRKPPKQKRFGYSAQNCHGCGRFVPSPTYVDCPNCGADNRP